MKPTPLEEYKIFENRDSYLAVLQDCLSAGYRPATVAEAMRRRIQAIREGSRDEHQQWVEQQLETSDALAYYQERVKVVYDYFNSLDKLTNVGADGHIHLTKKEFKLLPGREYQQSKLDQLARAGQYNTAAQAQSNELWRILARKQSLLDEYISVVYPVINQNFKDFRSDLVAIDESNTNLSGRGMRVLLYWLHPESDFPYDEPIIQPISLSGLYHWTSWGGRSQIQSDLTSCPWINRKGARLMAARRLQQ